jgi:deazaflavin-dependent oxidoreductase (nitroreductase family)
MVDLREYPADGACFTQIMTSTSTSDYNQQVIETFRSNHGSMPNGAPLMLLTTKGARSGQERMHPLAYTRDGERYVVLASKGGAPTNPDWYHNVVAHPDVTVEVGGQRFSAKASVAQGVERDRLFNAQAALMPNFGEYQRKTSRKIPVIVIDPTA